MARFNYNAMDADGQAVSGIVEAADRREAISLLADRSIYVTSISQGAEPQPEQTSSISWTWKRRIDKRVRVSMLRQLATALQAGLELLEALRVVREQAESDVLKDMVSGLADSVEKGQSLSEAMEVYPREFSPMEVSMVRVGETGGVLEQVMGHLADHAERELDVRQKIKSAATYPVFVLSLAFISVVVIVTVILPPIVATVTEHAGKASLPLATRILLSSSEFLRTFGWLVVLAIAGAILAFRSWVNRPEGRLAFDAFKLRIPVLGNALRKIAVARFARTLGMLSKSGIEILEALGVLRGTLGNEALARKIDQVAEDITQGRSIAEPLRQTGEFPPLLIQVIAMGEKTGRLDSLLLQTSDAYEKETTASIQRVMTVLPAVLIVFLALVVVFILAAVLLPIIGMDTTLPGM